MVQTPRLADEFELKGHIVSAGLALPPILGALEALQIKA